MSLLPPLPSAPPVVGAYIFLSGLGFKNESAAGLGALVLIAWVPTAIAVDAAVLGYEDAPVRTGFTWAPTVTPLRGGGTMGAVGSF